MDIPTFPSTSAHITHRMACGIYHNPNSSTTGTPVPVHTSSTNPKLRTAGQRAPGIFPGACSVTSSHGENGLTANRYPGGPKLAGAISTSAPKLQKQILVVGISATRRQARALAAIHKSAPTAHTRLLQAVPASARIQVANTISMFTLQFLKHFGSSWTLDVSWRANPHGQPTRKRFSALDYRKDGGINCAVSKCRATQGLPETILCCCLCLCRASASLTPAEYELCELVCQISVVCLSSVASGADISSLLCCFAVKRHKTAHTPWADFQSSVTPQQV